MATRFAASLNVVSRPTTSTPVCCRSKCSDQALSLPELQESKTRCIATACHLPDLGHRARRKRQDVPPSTDHFLSLPRSRVDCAHCVQVESRRHFVAGAIPKVRDANEADDFQTDVRQVEGIAASLLSVRGIDVAAFFRIRVYINGVMAGAALAGDRVVRKFLPHLAVLADLDLGQLEKTKVRIVSGRLQERI